MTSRAPMRLVSERPTVAHPSAFRALLFGMPTALLVLMVSLSTGQPTLQLGLLAVLCVLVVVATHRDTLFGDETSINGSIVVIACSVVAFRPDAWLLGPAICGILAGVHYDHFRDLQPSKVAINGSATGLSAVISASAFLVLTPEGVDDVSVTWAIPLAVTVYWVVNNVLIAAVLTAVTGSPLHEHARSLVFSETYLLVIGALGGFSGLLLSEGLDFWGVFSLVGLLTAADWAIASPREVQGETHHGSVRIVRLMGGLAACGAAAVLVAWLPPAPAAALGTVAGFIATITLVLIRVHRRLGSWERGLAAGAVLADSWLIGTFVVGGALAGATDVWIGGLVVLTGCGIAFASGAIRRQRKPAGAHPNDDELLVVAAVELAVLDAAESASPPR